MSLNNVSAVNGQNVLNLSTTIKTEVETDNFKNTLNNAIQSGEDEELKKACVQFESYFLNMMFKSMRKTVISNEGIFQKSNAEKMFQEMLDQELTKKMANQGGIGLADMMYKQLNKQSNAMDIEA
ncbi:rod-binding protein [[Clostridium] colinum]|uniref:rod-binding protein n=1 Tax=[Clostridium] colinum TaxID=36835 RepID=UPI002023EAAF|nr:rod-binding protein [[Clostridium] colinum]